MPSLYLFLDYDLGLHHARSLLLSSPLHGLLFEHQPPHSCSYSCVAHHVPCYSWSSCPLTSLVSHDSLQ